MRRDQVHAREDAWATGRATREGDRRRPAATLSRRSAVKLLALAGLGAGAGLVATDPSTPCPAGRAGLLRALTPSPAQALTSADAGVPAASAPTDDAVWRPETQVTYAPHGDDKRVVTYDDASAGPLPARWAYDAIKLPEAWAQLPGAPGAGVTVGMFDGDVWFGHPGLAAIDVALSDQQDLAIDESAREDADDSVERAVERTKHATGVASIIAATPGDDASASDGTVGIAYGCTLASVSQYASDVQKCTGAGDDPDHVSAHQYAFALTRLIREGGAKVVNLSNGLPWEEDDGLLGFLNLRKRHSLSAANDGDEDARSFIDACNKIVADALLDLLDGSPSEGIEPCDFVICKAAGNHNAAHDDELDEDGRGEGQDAFLDVVSGIRDPRLARRIIVVGGVQAVRPDVYRVGGYSACGSRVDVVAPGSFVYRATTLPGHDRSSLSPGYSGGYGTSFATPVVSAVAALVWGANPSLTGEEVKEIVCGTTGARVAFDEDDDARVRSIMDGDAGIVQDYGLVDAAAAVTRALSSAPLTSPAAPELTWFKGTYIGGVDPAVANVPCYISSVRFEGDVMVVDGALIRASTEERLTAVNYYADPSVIDAPQEYRFLVTDGTVITSMVGSDAAAYQTTLTKEQLMDLVANQSLPPSCVFCVDAGGDLLQVSFGS